MVNALANERISFVELLPVTRYEIGNVDLLRDTAQIKVYYPASRLRGGISLAGGS